MTFRHVKITLLLCFVVLFSGAQDIHFSNFDLSPLTLSPAQTGWMQSDKRVASIYRTQWQVLGKPLETFAISYDQKVYAIPYNLSAGLVFVSDRSGGIALVNNKIMLSLAKKSFLGLNTFSYGLQAGYVRKQLSMDDVTFPEQYSRDIGQFDPRLPNSESDSRFARGYFDLNAGALWSRKMKRGFYEAGISAFHLNSPDESLFNNSSKLKPRVVFNAASLIKLKSSLFLRPSLLVSRMERAQEMVGLMRVGKYLPSGNQIKSLYAGAGIRTGIQRNGDAAIAIVGAELKFFELALAYDVNYSDLKVATNSRGALEVALIWKSLSTEITHTTISCDRY
ncbi:MAG: PorP/SprF family type IX secretion system membrane protein [Crocinitomicaceae bacterium]|nr:PorP/SprF family type IX secretion system membrane protein [Crocinitomicaceae bacterium]